MREYIFTRFGQTIAVKAESYAEATDLALVELGWNYADHNELCPECGASEVESHQAGCEMRRQDYPEEFDLGPPDPQVFESRSYTRWEGETLPDGSIDVNWETNDDLERGFPGYADGVAREVFRFPSRKAFLHMSGGSRFGPSGHEVTVFLDGRNLEHTDVQRELGETQ